MTNTQRYFIELSYDGTHYHGWQLQPNALSMQEVLNKSFSTILRQPVYTTGCGRTDAGVHATQFFAHFDIKSVVDEPWTMDYEKVLRSINYLLPSDIAVKHIFPVAADANARFDANLR